MWRADPERGGLQGSRDAQREVQDARRQEHRAANSGGIGTDAAGQDAAWPLLRGTPGVDAFGPRPGQGGAANGGGIVAVRHQRQYRPMAAVSCWAIDANVEGQRIGYQTWAGSIGVG